MATAPMTLDCQVASTVSVLSYATAPAFHATQHFRAAKCIAVRLPPRKPEVLQSLLERRFREVARKASTKAHDVGRTHLRTTYYCGLKSRDCELNSEIPR